MRPYLFSLGLCFGVCLVGFCFSAFGLAVLGFVPRLCDTNEDALTGNDGIDIDWSSTASFSERSLLAVARALIASPELLCLHKPLKPYEYILTNNLVGVFREFCRGKGLEEPEEERPYRRPRTCIFTENSACRAWGADHIFMVQIFNVVYWCFEALVVGSSFTLMQFGVDPHIPHSSSLPQ